MSVLGYRFKELLFSIPSLLRFFNYKNFNRCTLKAFSAPIERDDFFFPFSLNYNEQHYAFSGESSFISGVNHIFQYIIGQRSPGILLFAFSFISEMGPSFFFLLYCPDLLLGKNYINFTKKAGRFSPFFHLHM